jgi:hypothetical protein
MKKFFQNSTYQPADLFILTVLALLAGYLVYGVGVQLEVWTDAKVLVLIWILLVGGLLAVLYEKISKEKAQNSELLKKTNLDNHDQ